MRLITFTPKTAPTSAPRVGALLPGNRSVLNFAVAVDASADVPLLTWFDLDDEWLPKASRSTTRWRRAPSASRPCRAARWFLPPTC